MATFDPAIEIVLAHELDPSDPHRIVELPGDTGGLTKYGIAQNKHPDLDVASLTLTDARDIYQRRYWRPEYAEIGSQAIASKVFDFAVNAGPRQAHLALQRALRACDAPGIEDDGVLGPRTLLAVNACRVEPLLAALRSEIAGFYRTLAATSEARRPFLMGWLRRAYS